MTPAALAQPAGMDEASQTLSAVAEIRGFSDERGTLSSITVEEKFEDGATTILLAPALGERTANGVSDTAFGLRGTIYQEWSPAFSTRTSLFLAERSPVFAHIDVAQDLTVRVADRTTLTTGIRWAEYFGEQEVTFVSLGARRYFGGGSIAYKLTGTRVDGQDSFFGHLINLRLDDSRGEGNTQLWLSAGDSALTQFNDTPGASNRGFMLQRSQPLWNEVALVAAAGLSAYDSSGDRYTATSFRIGLAAKLD